MYDYTVGCVLYTCVCLFGRYLSEHIPSMTILPIRVDIALLRNNIVLPDVEIKAQDRWESFMVNNLLCRHNQLSVDNNALSLWIGFVALARESQLCRQAMSCWVTGEFLDPSSQLQPVVDPPLVSFRTKLELCLVVTAFKSPISRIVWWWEILANWLFCVTC